jgi:uncharacterized membrane protein YuzA (DUF378 family)
MKLLLLDLLTLVLIIAAGLQLGLLGFFEWDPAAGRCSEATSGSSS